jgi:hypothetical protein
MILAEEMLTMTKRLLNLTSQLLLCSSNNTYGEAGKYGAGERGSKEEGKNSESKIQGAT